MRKRHPRQQTPFPPPLREGGSIFVYSRKERYDTTTASKASNPNLSCQYSFFYSCLPDSRPLILLFYHFQFFFYFVYRLTRPPESNRSRSFKLFFFCPCVRLARLSLKWCLLFATGVTSDRFRWRRAREKERGERGGGGLGFGRLLSLLKETRREVKAARILMSPTNRYKKQHQHQPQKFSNEDPVRLSSPFSFAFGFTLS